MVLEVVVLLLRLDPVPVRLGRPVLGLRQVHQQVQRDQPRRRRALLGGGDLLLALCVVQLLCGRAGLAVLRRLQVQGTERQGGVRVHRAVLHRQVRAGVAAVVRRDEEGQQRLVQQLVLRKFINMCQRVFKKYF